MRSNTNAQKIPKEYEGELIANVPNMPIVFNLLVLETKQMI